MYPPPLPTPQLSDVHMTISKEYPGTLPESHYPLTPSPDNIRSYSPLIHSSPSQWQHTGFHHPLSAPPGNRTPSPDNIRSYSSLIHSSPSQWQHTGFHHPLSAPPGNRTPSPDNIRSYSSLIHSSPSQWQHTGFHHPLSAPPGNRTPSPDNIRSYSSLIHSSPSQWQHTGFHHPLSAPPGNRTPSPDNIRSYSSLIHSSPSQWQHTGFHHPLSAPPGNKGNIVFPEFVKFLVQPEVDPYRNGLPMLPGQSDSPPPTYYRWNSGMIDFMVLYNSCMDIFGVPSELLSLWVALGSNLGWNSKILSLINAV